MYGREANTHDESLCGGGGAVVEVGVVWMMRVCVEGVGLLLRCGLYGQRA